MLKSDLKQIKQIVDTSLKKAIDTSVKKAIDTSVKQIVDKSLDEKLDKKFKENNKKIFKKIEESAEEVGIIVNDSFVELEGKMNKRFNKVDNRLDGINQTLKKKADKNTLLDWADKRILSLELDCKKTKYLHIEKWKNLPSATKINNTLIKEGIK